MALLLPGTRASSATCRAVPSAARPLAPTPRPARSLLRARASGEDQGAGVAVLARSSSPSLETGGGSARPASPDAQNSAVPATFELQARMAAASHSRRAELDAEAAERARMRALEDAGVKWWQVAGPPNMVLCSTPLEVAAAVERAASGGLLAVLCVFSEGCYACRSLAPKLRQIAEAHADAVTFVKVNGTAPEGSGNEGGGGGAGGAGGQGADRDLGAWARSALGVERLPWFMLYAPGDWEAGRPAAAFTASLRPDKLAMLRKEISAAASRVPAAAAGAGAGAAVASSR